MLNSTPRIIETPSKYRLQGDQFAVDLIPDRATPGWWFPGEPFPEQKPPMV